MTTHASPRKGRLFAIWRRQWRNQNQSQTYSKRSLLMLCLVGLRGHPLTWAFSPLSLFSATSRSLLLSAKNNNNSNSYFLSFSFTCQSASVRTGGLWSHCERPQRASSAPPLPSSVVSFVFSVVTLHFRGSKNKKEDDNSHNACIALPRTSAAMAPTTTAATSSSSRDGAGLLLPIAVAAAGVLCLWKVLQTCSVPVHPRCVAVVYDTRRKSVLCTSADREMAHDALPRVSHFSLTLYATSAWMCCNRTRLFVPPSSFFGVFTLPRGVFEVPGESVNCAVEGVAVCDGSVNMMVTVLYTIHFDQLERYLAAVGPVAPNEAIAKTVAHVARVRSADVSAGFLLSKNRRDGVFTGPFREHLTTKLMSEAAVSVTDVIVEQVVLLEGS